MSEWIRLERLNGNNFSLPAYSTAHSAGMDFAACLTRPCFSVIPPPVVRDDPTVPPPKKWPFLAFRSGRVANPGSEGVPPHLCIAEATEAVPGVPTNVAAQDLELSIKPLETVIISLGWKSEFSYKHVLLFLPRSSTGTLGGLQLANSAGVVDADYRGELFAAIFNRNRWMLKIQHGERIVQGLILPVAQVIINEHQVAATARGENGFGSTGTMAMAGGAAPEPTPKYLP